MAGGESAPDPQPAGGRAPHLALGVDMGHAVLEAQRFRTRFTHMEWFLKDDGEAVFGEIGVQPGARSVDIMSYASDVERRRLHRLGPGRVPRPLLSDRRAQVQRRGALQARRRAAIGAPP